MMLDKLFRHQKTEYRADGPLWTGDTGNATMFCNRFCRRRLSICHGKIVVFYAESDPGYDIICRIVARVT
jgi:hypothetical protein